MRRRHLLAMPLGLLPLAAPGVQRGAVLRFPRDHGAHLEARTEWWYLTGWLGTPQQPTHGFQLTFFRSRTGLPEVPGSRFSAPHLLFAHAAVTDLALGRHTHAQQVGRFAGQAGALAAASQADTELRLGPWRLARQEEAGLSRYDAGFATPAHSLNLQLRATLPPLLQGEAGWSQKGPAIEAASHYVTEAPLALQGTLQEGARRRAVQGTAWLDHEWSNELLAPGVVGWDWIGMNLFDGRSLTAFQLRRADGSVAWAGGSTRGARGPSQAFGPQGVHWQPGRRWASPASRANYPLQWTLTLPEGRFTVRALLDDQEIDSRASTGAFYWEGLSELLDDQGRRVGLGYLEMTGYAGALALGG